LTERATGTFTSTFEIVNADGVHPYQLDDDLS
jgi:hypothetical protein